MIDFSVAWDGGYRAFRADGGILGKVFKGLLGDLAKIPEDVGGTSEQNAQTVVSQAMQRVQWPP
ncbi:MAG: hypothetical protein KBF50_03145 [Steroidobacteraceae bacterium]|nr:hypothetical protein [Pseudomonadota bacterium]MBP9129250.1 hypothetical protein [Steroidobacteraceae bacterium]